ESEEKIQNAEEALAQEKWAASIYYSYQSIVNSAKALLTSEKVKTNNHASIIKDFDRLYVESGKIDFSGSFEAITLRLNKNKPTQEFATRYLEDAKHVLEQLESYRKLELTHV
ncbi:MAG: HEPN domain-containing protein, partial [Flavobacteriaceae bacterium]